MKSIRGGGATGGGRSSIPVVRSPVKTSASSASAPVSAKKKTGNLQRQGTFTKDEPTSSIPVPIKKIASPVKKAPLCKFFLVSFTIERNNLEIFRAQLL